MLILVWHLFNGDLLKVQQCFLLLENQASLLTIIKQIGINKKYSNELILNKTVAVILKTYQIHGLNIMTIYDDLFPIRNDEIARQPLVLTFKGNHKILQNHKLSFCSEKNMGPYAKKIMSDILSSNVNFALCLSILSSNLQLIYECCQKYQRQIIIVLASGFDQIYPLKYLFLLKSLYSNMLIVSFYPLKKRYQKECHLKLCNEHLYFLNSMIVLECFENSVQLSTISAALHANVNILIVPGSLFDRRLFGNFQCIFEGAQLYLKPNDLKMLLGIQ